MTSMVRLTKINGTRRLFDSLSSLEDLTGSHRSNLYESCFGCHIWKGSMEHLRTIGSNLNRSLSMHRNLPMYENFPSHRKLLMHRQTSISRNICNYIREGCQENNRDFYALTEIAIYLR